MSKPNNDAGMPIAITLDPGTYYRCRCGGSATLPFCDGSHSSDEQPVVFTLDKRQKVFLCSCGRTATPPMCDQRCGVEVAP